MLTALLNLCDEYRQVVHRYLLTDWLHVATLAVYEECLLSELSIYG